ncbi:prolyl aminopeptidase [Gordonia westfalica]|uniref:Proline iminopeptidase n=1 Tax=Gordonia westfalica TaxID=158898 RepID=A0ABU2H0M1_9ACTN|nr:prolyl aminopeptidase [Gordonia westfalica]MDS1116745.1 prolyl aminopeptidase [Gordonia westfalica]
MTVHDELRDILHPPIEPRTSGLLAIEDQWIYWEESGNPAGKPVIVLHGGPGGGSRPVYRRYFDPDHYRIIQMDQRGCGQSQPNAGDWASLSRNTTWTLVDDIEALRRYLGIESWVVFGGSWGSTLALAYSQKHPARVLDLILRGIFLIRNLELRWFYGGGGAHLLFPDYWQEFTAPLDPSVPVESAIDEYHKLLEGPDRAAAIRAALSWTRWEAKTSTLLMDSDGVDLASEPRSAIAFARIENHYFRHSAFLASNQLLDQADVIKDIPCTIVHGRYDVVCPMANAFDLHSRLPRSTLVIVDDAGHAMSEPGIARALVEATEKHSH